MLWTPSPAKELVQSNIGSAATVFGTSVTTGAAAATKGTPAELIASCNFDVYSVRIWITNVGLAGATSQCAVDLLGGVSTEEVLIANLLAGGAGAVAVAGKGPKSWEFPLYIPAGTRLAAQAAGERTSVAINFAIELRGGYGTPPPWTCGKFTTYGMGTVPVGAPVTPGQTGADGAWTQIVASTTEDHKVIVPSFQLGTDLSAAARALVLDVGFGAAAAERSFGALYHWDHDINEMFSGPYNTAPIKQAIPAGTRLAARASNSGSNDTGYNVALHCGS